GASCATVEVYDLDEAEWLKVALVILGSTALTQFVDNVPGVFGGVIKALIGAATAGLTAWTVAYENDVPGLHVVSQGEGLTIAIAVITALSVVYQIPEPPKPTTMMVVDTGSAGVR